MKSMYVISTPEGKYIRNGFFKNPITKEDLPLLTVNVGLALSFPSSAKAWKHIESTPYMIGVFEIKLIVIKGNA
jgi:hypothetical protein